LSYIGVPELILLYPQYAQGNFYSDQIKQLVSYLSDYRKDGSWPSTLDEFEGKDSVPIMTIHKSKGLEYHTVVFVGLEDSAFWGFKGNRKEESCNFFVAFSRAKKRVIFTFCRQRPRRPGESANPQSHESIGELYDLLKAAGIEPEEVS
jgi:superfamily I DNA/RNA helicase